jgi:prephenate dehydrogenase
VRAPRRRPVAAIAGLGLVGGSLARALTRAGWAVIGVDRAPVLARARRARAIARAAALEEAAAAADVVVLAAPPDANLRLLRRLARFPDVVSTDVGSVKRPIGLAAARLGLRSFVGGHPMAGSERSGFAASSPDLFRGRPWILTPGPAPRGAIALVRRLVHAAGARVVAMDAREHDRAVAFLSHLPQLAAWALLDAARADGVARRRLALAGPGFRDMTRLARSSRGLWRQILAHNRGHVAVALRALIHELERRLRRPG